MSFDVLFLYYVCDFRLSSIKALFYNGLRLFFGEIVVIFGVVKSGGILDFSMFCRTHYRTQNEGRGVETTDMPFPAIEHLF